MLKIMIIMMMLADHESLRVSEERLCSLLCPAKSDQESWPALFIYYTRQTFRRLCLTQQEKEHMSLSGKRLEIAKESEK